MSTGGNNMPDYMSLASMSSLTLDAIAGKEEDAVVVDYILQAASSGAEIQTHDLKYGFDELCPVCGDRVSGYHYGLLTCESCKGFFKRTVQNKKVYSCVDNRSCHIDKSQRKRCPFCRFQKCLNVGMKLEAVRTDRMRGGRNKFGPMYKRDRALKQQALRQQHQMLASCQMRMANGMPPFTGNGPMTDELDIKPDHAMLMAMASGVDYTRLNGMNGINMNVSVNNNGINMNVNVSNQSPICSSVPSPVSPDNSATDLRMTVASMSAPHTPLSPTTPSSHAQGMYPVPHETGHSNNYPPTTAMNSYQPPYYHAVPHPATLPLLPELIVDLKANMADENEIKHKLLTFIQSELGHEDITAANYPSKLLRLLCRLSDQLLFLLVEWARTSMFFKDLKVEDQMKLLQNSWSEILILDLAQRLLRQTWSGELQLANGYKLNLDSLDDLGLGDMKEAILNIVRKIKDLKIDHNEYTCLKFLILLNPDVPDIDNPEYVETCQEKVQAALMEYCLNFYPNVPDKFSQVLLRLPEVRMTSNRGEEFLYYKHLSGEMPEQTLLMEMLHSKKK